MAVTTGPILTRNIVHQTKVNTPRENGVRSSLAGDKRLPDSHSTIVDLTNLSTERSRDLTSTQTPQLRINVTRLVRPGKDSWKPPEGTNPLKKRLLFKRRCQIQLTIQHQHNNGSHEGLILYSDHRNASVTLTQNSATHPGAVELDAPFEVERYKLFVVNTTESKWKYSMAPPYQLKFALRFLDCDDLDEFLPHMFDQSSRPPARDHAVFRGGLLTPLTTDQRFTPFLYRSTSSKRETGYELLIDMRWVDTTKSCLQLIQTHAPRLQTNRRGNEVKFVIGEQNPKTLTTHNYECVLCDRKSQGSVEGLDDHLRTCHTHLSFVRTNVEDNGRISIQFTITSVRPKTSNGGYIATPPESVNTPPHDLTSGFTSWLDNGKWVASNDSTENVSAESERQGDDVAPSSQRKSTNGHDHPRQGNSFSHLGRSHDTTDRRHLPNGASPASAIRTVGMSSSISGISDENRVSRDSMPLSSRRTTSGGEKDRRNTSLEERTQGRAGGSPQRSGAYTGFGPAAVADMSRVSETRTMKQNPGDFNDSHQESEHGEPLRHGISRSGSNASVQHTNGKFPSEDLLRHRPDQICTQKSMQTPATNTNNELKNNRTITHIVTSGPNAPLNNGVNIQARKGGGGQQMSPTSEAYRSPHKDATFTQNSFNSPIHSTSQTNKQSVGYSPRSSMYDHSAASRGRSRPSAEHVPLGSPPNMTSSSIRSLPPIPKAVQSPSQISQQFRLHTQPNLAGISPRLKFDRENDSSSSVSSGRALHILKDSPEILRLAQDLAKPLPEVGRRTYPVPVAAQGVTLFRSSTKRALVEGEYVSESEDEIDDAWARRRHQETIDINSDTTVAEKAFMKRWDAHFAREQLSGNTRAAIALHRFTAANQEWLLGDEMFREYSLKLATWLGSKLINWQDAERCMALLKHVQTTGPITGKKTAVDAGMQGSSSAEQNTSAKRSAGWLSACSCGVPVNVADTPTSVSCAHYFCASPDYHLACVKLEKRPEIWYCPACKTVKG